MCKFFFFITLFSLAASCGGKKNVDEKFRDQIDGDTSYYDEANPDNYYLWLKLERVSNKNFLISLAESKGNTYQSSLISVDRNTKEIYSEQKLVGKMLCLVESCNEFRLVIFNRFSIKFEMDEVRILAKFGNEASFNIVDKGFYFNIVAESYGKVFENETYFSAYTTLPVNYEKILLVDYASRKFENYFNVSLPVLLNGHDIYYRTKAINYLKDESVYRGAFFDFMDNKTKFFYLKVENAF